ncbi:MAG: hypothetical protein LWX56_02635 [Ignavibacteria bacterium]|nr:hypothetical protein [Ignavibacteria bacterium]
MKKIYVSILLLFCFPISLFSQIPGIYQRMVAPSIEYSLYLKWDNHDSCFKYQRDNVPSGFIPLDTNMYFDVNNDDNNSLNIYLQFYNPMKFNIGYKIEAGDDLAYTMFNKMITMMSGKILDYEKLAAALKDMENNLPQVTDLAQPANAGALADADKEVAGIAKDISRLPAKTYPKSKSLAEIYKYIYLMDGDTISKSVPEAIYENLTQLAKASTFDEFNAAYKKGAELQTRMEADYKKAGKYVLPYYKSVIADFCKKIELKKDAAAEHKSEGAVKKDVKKDAAAQAAEDKKENEIIYSSSLYLNNNNYRYLQNTIDDIHDLQEQYKTLLDQVKKIIDGYESKNSNYYTLLKSTKLSLEKNKQLNVQLKNWTIDSEKGKILSKQSIGFAVVPQRKLFPFFSLGTFYSAITTPQYDIQDISGRKTIVRVDNSKEFGYAALYANLVLLTWKDPNFIPFIQVGVAKDKNYLLPVGVGVSFGETVSVSTGGVFHWYDELSTKKPGDIVGTDFSLKDDYKTVLKVNWYVSVNIAFYTFK